MSLSKIYCFCTLSAPVAGFLTGKLLPLCGKRTHVFDNSPRLQKYFFFNILFAQLKLSQLVDFSGAAGGEVVKLINKVGESGKVW